MSNSCYQEISCDSALNRLKRKMPYSWDLNIYRGCEHGCTYCYACYSHDYLQDDNFASSIYVKTNVAEQLEKQLSDPAWNREIVNIGGVTDSYQPAEEHYRIMPAILKLLIKYRTPAIISTKSDLVLRDFALIAELAQITYINIAATITTTNEKLRSILEPGGVESGRRFSMLKTFRNTNASVGLHVMPIIPYLTDDYENIDSLMQMARDSDVHYVLTGTLYLRGKSRAVFFSFIKNHFPDIYDNLKILYKTGSAGKEYKNELYKIVNELRDKYSLSSSYAKLMQEKLK